MNIRRWLGEQFKFQDDDDKDVDSDAEPIAGQYLLLAMYPYYNNLFGINLERAGFVIRKRTTIDSTLTQLKEVSPGLVILLFGDSQPKSLELLRMIKSTQEFAAIPVIGVVEEKRGDLIPQAYAAGIEQCYLIPISPLDLVSCARRIILSQDPV